MKVVASFLFAVGAILMSHVAYATTCWTGTDGDMVQVPCSPGINDGDGGGGGFGVGYGGPSPGGGGGAPVGGKGSIIENDSDPDHNCQTPQETRKLAAIQASYSYPVLNNYALNMRLGDGNIDQWEVYVANGARTLQLLKTTCSHT